MTIEVAGHNTTQARCVLSRDGQEVLTAHGALGSRTMEHSELARLVQIDYTREMAFIAIAPGPDGQPQTLGVVRAMTDPDNINAEFGIIIRSELKGKGLGQLLMDKLID